MSVVLLFQQQQGRDSQQRLVRFSLGQARQHRPSLPHTVASRPVEASHGANPAIHPGLARLKARFGSGASQLQNGPLP